MKNHSMKKTPLLALGAALLLGPACAIAPDDELSELEAGGLSIVGGKADGHGEYDVHGTRLLLHGEAAGELYGILDDAGLESGSRRGLTYVVGARLACVTNGAESACEISSRIVDEDREAFTVTIHGERFRSAASELFGALAAVSGVDPRDVLVVESGRYICGKDSYEVWCGLRPRPNLELELSFEGLGALGADFVYEGWLITEDGPVSSGRFDAPEGEGEPHFSLDAGLADAASMFVLTIEPRFGDDPAPADTHVLAGVFEDGMAMLAVEHPAALGTDFSSAAGGFILETPSSASVAEDFEQGIWFLAPAAGPGPGLSLPELAAGWAYEGWVVGEDGPISTGRFTDTAAADSDGAGLTAGPDGTPPFPGQDFIDPPMNLLGTTVVISVEPMPDDSPAPFAIKPLLGMVMEAGPGEFQTLDATGTDTLPSGTAVLVR